jgi:hypothetical protein
VKNLVARLEVIGVRPEGERVALRAEIGWRLENADGSAFPLEDYKAGLAAR